jgi:hypothetical protein
MCRAPFLFFLFALIISCGQPVREEAQVEKTTKPRKAITSPFKPGVVIPVELLRSKKSPYEELVRRSGDSVFYCSYKGKVEWSDTLRKTRFGIFDLDAEFLVDKVYLANLPGGKYFIVWQETDHEGVKSYAAVYKAGGAKAEWKQRFDVPNPGQPAVDGNYAYITTRGMAGKISLDNGKFAWIHDSLYSPLKHYYQKFEPVKVFPDKVVFVDYPVAGRRSVRDTLTVDPETGERIKK